MISSPTTMTPPKAPSGLYRQNCQRPCRTAAMRLGDPLLFFSSRSPQGATSIGLLRICSQLLGIVSVADPGVEEGVERVDDQVDQDHHAHDEQVHALDHRIVALVDRVEEKAAHPGQPEDALEDHGAAQDLGDLDAEYGDDRDQGVL